MFELIVKLFLGFCGDFFAGMMRMIEMILMVFGWILRFHSWCVYQFKFGLPVFRTEE